MAKKTPELVAEALRLRGQGVTTRAIGKQLGVTHATIRRWTDPEAAEKALESTRKYLEANREKDRERKRKYHEAHRERHLESSRKYHEANRERIRERKRQHYEANREKKREKGRKYYEANREARQEYGRKYREANNLKHAKGKPLRSNYVKAQRPLILTRLLLQVAKDFCLEWNFPVEQMFDADVLRSAARTIRESPFLNGERNPWYGTDYLHESTVTSNGWAYHLARSWRNRV